MACASVLASRLLPDFLRWWTTSCKMKETLFSLSCLCSQCIIAATETLYKTAYTMMLLYLSKFFICFCLQSIDAWWRKQNFAFLDMYPICQISLRLSMNTDCKKKILCQIITFSYLLCFFSHKYINKYFGSYGYSLEVVSKRKEKETLMWS